LTKQKFKKVGEKSRIDFTGAKPDYAGENIEASRQLYYCFHNKMLSGECLGRARSPLQTADIPRKEVKK